MKLQSLKLLKFHFVVVLFLKASGDKKDGLALLDMYNSFGKPQQLQPWSSGDPCENGWIGTTCGIGKLQNRVVQLQLNKMNLSGTLSPSVGKLDMLTLLDISYNPGISGNIPNTIGNLQQLTLLNFDYCTFTGEIPSSIGSLGNLSHLQLTGNELTGEIPPELGNLKKVTWFDISENRIEGQLPVSPGIDYLPVVRHLHFNNNSLTGSIPPQLGNISSLWHLVVDNNSLSGELPPELSKLQNITVIRLSNNHFTGSIPKEYGEISSLVELSASNAGITGKIPTCSGATSLQKLDLSDNKLEGGIPKELGFVPTLLQTLNLGNCSLTGGIDPSLGRLSNLQALFLQDNHLSGSLPEGLGLLPSLMILDAEDNNISGSIPMTILNSSQLQSQFYGNPLCSSPKYSNSPLCQSNRTQNLAYNANRICPSLSCPSEKAPNPAEWSLSMSCVCATPVNLMLLFTGATFVRFTDELADELESDICQQLGLVMPSQCLLQSAINVGPNVQVVVQFFPTPNAGESLSKAVANNITRSFGNYQISLGSNVRTYVVLDYAASNTADRSAKKRWSGGAIAAIVIAALFGTITLLVALIFIVKKRRPTRNPSLDDNRYLLSGSSNRRLSLDLAHRFSLAELSAATQGFSDTCKIGSGGYGNVYRGILREGTVVAIKRSSPDSKQGSNEFFNEIELLSRVHHKNLVTLQGYCDEAEEQILVYQYVAGGNLRDHLSGKLPRLTWRERVSIAVGTARGLTYLHFFVTPPIIHRDIKSTNILLDDNLVAKVCDFGLSKLAQTTVDNETTHVTTQVKGTLGYLDPEYYMNQRLSTKSDVYSFGVLVLELITGQAPITEDGHITARVKETMQESKGVEKLADPTMGPFSKDSLAEMLYVGLQCVKEAGSDRPSMGDVLADLEMIDELPLDSTV